MRAAWLLLIGCLGCGGSDASDGWERQSIPETRFIHAIWAFSPDDVWASGDKLLHFDGASWTESSNPAFGFVDLWGFAPDSLYGVSGSKLWYWNGSVWTPTPVGEDSVLQAVWGTSRTDLWVAGANNSETYHFDGSTWQLYRTQAVSIIDLWGSGSNDVWQVGQVGQLYRWNGSTWTEHDRRSFGPSRIWGFAADDIWAPDNSNGLGHFDGTTWNVTETEQEHFGVWGASPDDVWAVGDGGAISHFDGSSWSESSLDNDQLHLNVVHGSPAGDVWIAGFLTRDSKAYLARH